MNLKYKQWTIFSISNSKRGQRHEPEVDALLATSVLDAVIDSIVQEHIREKYNAGIVCTILLMKA